MLDQISKTINTRLDISMSFYYLFLSTDEPEYLLVWRGREHLATTSKLSSMLGTARAIVCHFDNETFCCACFESRIGLPIGSAKKTHKNRDASSQSAGARILKAI
ncbi:hypothetical protein CUN61_18800 [Pseudomonas arsenicoxydans]|uniref:Uncharacterized protein n=1 Tax=Pseudomonas arsenicoxydans TaxID=702115 RepID=A0A4P6G4F4_9PSED|nr:hypothetical protein CUN61_18800 [Pseudomonas arsenicoxydans]